MVRFPKFNFERRVVDHRLPFGRSHLGMTGSFTPNAIQATKQYYLKQVIGAYQFWILVGMVTLGTMSLVAKMAWVGYSPAAWEKSRFARATPLKEERWVESSLSSSSKSWDLVTSSIDGDVQRRRDWRRDQ